MQKRHNLYRLCRFYIYTNLLLYLNQSIYISTMHLCLLSNESLLAVKCIYACYQMYLCLLSKMFLIPVKDVFLLSKT